jgi:peptidoglycan/xylan/chitin deacetylase (PgdA/CDA1 family)
MMPRRRPRFDERTLFAILLLEFGVLLPLLSALLSPGVAPAVARPVLPTASLSGQAGELGQLPTVERLGAKDQRHASTAQPPTADVGQPVAELSAPTATSLSLPVKAPPQLPQPTITNTPEPLAAILGPADAAAQSVPTLFPTLVGAGDSGADQAGAAALDVPGGAPPILMYHYIRRVDQDSDPLGWELSVAPELFEAQLAWLHEQGYRTVRMDAVARCLRGEVPCPAKAVALTFDDGYADAFTTALPVLQRYGFTATFYVISGPVGQPGYMSWEQIAALRDAGMEIGAHTIDHFDLTTLDEAESARQIAQSKADIEQRLGISVVSFCYPTGLYNWTIEEQTRAAGFLSATTTRWDGDYSDVMALPRRRIAGGTGVDGFAAIVQGY